MNKLFLFILFLAFFITAGVSCNVRTNDDRIVVSGNTPTEMFEAVIADPIPNEIRSLEGYGETSQGHNIYLTFAAPDSFIEKIIDKYEFEAVICQDKALDALFTLPTDYVKKMPFWDIKPPRIHSRSICYRQDARSNKWTSSADSQFLMVELKNDVSTPEPYWKVYFHETGI